MKTVYSPTYLEKWIVDQYRNHRIYYPEDLNEAYIAQAYRIYYRQSLKAHSIEHGNFRLICVTETKDKQQQKEEFFHELCHVLLHAGRQIMMPKAFQELQEYQAKRFTQYAAIPFHMLFQFDLRDPNIVNILSERFKVTPKLCHERLTRIYNNRKVIKRG